MVMCTLAGRGDGVLVVTASLARPKDDHAANIAWASLVMLPLLAESLNGVSTESTIVFIAFPGHKPSTSKFRMVCAATEQISAHANQSRS